MTDMRDGCTLRKGCSIEEALKSVLRSEMRSKMGRRQPEGSGLGSSGWGLERGLRGL